MENRFLAIFLVLALLPTAALAGDATTNNGNSTGNNTGNVSIIDFSANIVNGTAPLTVTFTGEVTGVVKKVTWIFGNEHITVNSADALIKKYTFKEPGVYDVTLKVKGSSDKVESKTKKGYITVTKPAPTCNKKIVTATRSGKTVTFTYNGVTSGVKKYQWNFGDGKSSSGKTLTKVSHKYSKAGWYVVNLYVQNANNKWTHVKFTVTVK